MKLLGFSCLFYRYGCHPQSGWSPLHLLCLQGGHNESCGRESHTLPWCWNSFRKSIHVDLYSFCWRIVEANVNQMKPCLNMIWKSSGSISIICLTLNLSLSLIVMDFGKFILLLLKVMLTSFQSTSITSQI